MMDGHVVLSEPDRSTKQLKTPEHPCGSPSCGSKSPEARDRQGGDLPRGSRLASSPGMTISTTKDLPSEASAGAAIEPRTTRKTEPGIAVPNTTSAADLESRIKLRRAELLGKLGETRADTRRAATETRARLRARLSDLAHIIKMGVVDGWANLDDSVKHRLLDWLAASEHPVSRPNQPARSGQS
jgi:hypothetical protein